MLIAVSYRICDNFLLRSISLTKLINPYFFTRTYHGFIFIHSKITWSWEEFETACMMIKLCSPLWYISGESGRDLKAFYRTNISVADIFNKKKSVMTYYKTRKRNFIFDTLLLKFTLFEKTFVLGRYSEEYSTHRWWCGWTADSCPFKSI